MRRSSRLTSNTENDAAEELKDNKNQLNDKVTSIDALDNGTMLAIDSLVSKRFRDLIQNHRHSLALLYIDRICMFSFPIVSPAITIFGKELSSEAYNEWIIWNNYSKEIALESQGASTQNTQNIPNVYQLCAYANYKDPNHRELDDRTSVFFVRAKLNNENWPPFQHFIRLATDPFIYINCVQLTYQKDVFNLLAEAINSDCNRIQCKELNFDLNGDSQKTITWAKNHMCCKQFYIYDKADLNEDEALLDFFLTGGRCTRSIKIRDYDLSKAAIVLVQNFLDLESWDDYQGVQSIESSQITKNQDIQLLKNDYAKFIVKEEHDEDDHSISYVFELTNNAIRKKLQLLSTVFDDENVDSYSRIPVLSMNIKHL